MRKVSNIWAFDGEALQNLGITPTARKRQIRIIERETEVGGGPNPRNLQWMANEQDVQAVVSAMQAAVDSAEAQAHGCRALSRLVDSNGAANRENKVKIVRAGGVEAVVDGMKHAGWKRLQAWGCRALWMFDENNGENKMKIGRAEGIEAVVDGMKLHTDSAGVQEGVAGVYQNLATDGSENRVKIVMAGGIEAVVDGMKPG